MGKNGTVDDSKRNFRQWLDLQREMQSALEYRLHQQLDDEPAFLASYRRRYERQFPDWTGRQLTPDELTERLLAGDIIMLGDFHSLAQSQRTAMRVLRRLLKRGFHPALALEMIPTHYQTDIDAYLAGQMTEREFLDLVRCEAWWDFPWAPIHALLRLARRHALPVLGLNSDVASPDRALQERDTHAANVIADYRETHPERPLLVFFGDFHLADGHLPAALTSELEARDIEADVLRVFQNFEPLFWESLNWNGRSPEILELDSGDLCIQSATPLVKLQSYIYWLTFHEPYLYADDEEFPDQSWIREDLGREVGAALKRIARYLRIPLLEQEAPHVYWVGDEDFARDLARKPGWTRDDLAQVQSALAQGEDSYLPPKDLAVLIEPGQNRIAEMAARVLHERSAKISDRPRSLTDDFYLRVIRHALVFLGSKLINPLRKSRDKPYLLRFLREEKTVGKDWRIRAELLLSYLRAEETFLDTGSLSGFSTRYYQLRGPQHLALTRSVGRNLGARLYEALISDRVSRFWLRELFFKPFHLEGSPSQCYFDCLEKLGIWAEDGLAEAEGERL